MFSRVEIIDERSSPRAKRKAYSPGANNNGSYCKRCCCAKGSILFGFSLMALLFGLGAVAAPWYFVYIDGDRHTEQQYYTWDGILEIVEWKDGDDHDSYTERFTWQEMKDQLPNLYRLYMLTMGLVVIGTFLLLAVCITILVTLLVPSTMRRIPRRSFKPLKWVLLVLMMLALACFVVAFGYFVQHPKFMERDIEGCVKYQCESLIGESKPKSGSGKSPWPNLRIWMAFIGWESAICTSIFLLVVIVLLMCFHLDDVKEEIMGAADGGAYGFEYMPLQIHE
ncbi:hypothetical protein QOT17_006724 [Balamuthia mandrillaris]